MIPGNHRRNALRIVHPGLALALGLVGMSLLAPAGTIRDDRDDTLYTDLAAQPQFAPYGPIRSASSGNIVCSGTLVAADYVLAAAHCVDFISTPSNYVFEVGGTQYPLAEIITSPEWPPGNPSPPPSTDGGDIALVRLAAPVSGITPAELYRGTADLGATGICVGYGVTGTGITGAISGTDGTRRAGENVLDSLGSTFGVDDRLILWDFDQPGNPSASLIGGVIPLDLEYQMADKDSGAGIFIQSGGQWFLEGVGVIIGDTTGGKGDGIFSNYGDVSGATRVMPHLTWIDPIICPGDIDGNRSVDVSDLLALLAAWGPCPPLPNTCPSDFDDDGAVTVTDLLILLGAWGACP